MSVAIQSLIHPINLHGKNLIGIEVGVWKADSFCMMLDNCPNIKELHGVDLWEPFVDYIDEPMTVVNEKQIEFDEMIARWNIKWCPNNEKAIIHKMNSDDLVKEFDDEHFDFIFLDAHLTREQIDNDLKVWYPKLKRGGLFMGHDYNSSVVSESVHAFRTFNDIKTPISIFDNAFVWNKE